MSRFLAVVALAVAFAFGLATPALAMPPAPRVLARARHDAALRASLTTLLKRMRLRGFDKPRAKSAGLRLSSGPTSGSTAARVNPWAPTPGANRVLVLLVDFPDKAHQVASTFFDDLVFKNGAETESVRGFYKKMSYGNVDLVTLNLPSATGWLRLPTSYSTYVGSDYGTQLTHPNAEDMVHDAVVAADPYVDFSQYAGGTGVVSHLIVVHAGSGEEVHYPTGTPDIWSHSSSISPYLTNDGVYVSPYTTMPEYWLTASPPDMTIGVYCHELGHDFGLPDLYDTSAWASEGDGRWSLMAGGSWNGPGGFGGSPSRFDAWSETDLGFAAPTVVSVTASTTLFPVDFAGSDIVRVGADGATSGTEYFLLENRRLRGTDSYLPAQGLLIWHIDETRAGNDDHTHFLVTLEEAHGGTQDLSLAGSDPGSNGGDPLDPFGTGPDRRFDDSSDPNALVWAGNASRSTPSDVRVSGISASSETSMEAKIAILTLPDLTLSVTSFSGSVTQGFSTPISWRETNVGATAGSSSKTRFYLSSAPVLDGVHEVPLAPDATVPAMSAHTSYDAIFSIQVPPSYPTGQAYLLIQANADGSLAESDVTNDLLAVPLTVLPPEPDLSVSVDGIVPVSAYAGSAVTVSWTVTNHGTLQSPPTVLSIAASGNGAWGAPGNAVLGSAFVGGLPAGASAHGTTSATLPLSMLSGTGYIVANVDPSHSINEASYSDNIANRAFSVRRPASTRFSTPAVRSASPGFRITSRLYGAPGRSRVAVQVYYRSAWRTRAWTITSSGAVSARVRPGSAYRGVRKVRLLYPGSTGYSSSASRAVTARIL